jgi:NAD(P)-dependent dehydrogenase (short-subunit alcohol dehydrogenase family)
MDSNDVTQQLSDQGFLSTKVVCVSADITSSDSIEELVRTALKDHGRLDWFVSRWARHRSLQFANAGILDFEDISSTTDEHMVSIIRDASLTLASIFQGQCSRYHELHQMGGERDGDCDSIQEADGR